MSDEERLKIIQDFADKFGFIIFPDTNQFVLQFKWGNGFSFGNLDELESYFIALTDNPIFGNNTD